jgi:hypothetical protein
VPIYLLVMCAFDSAVDGLRTAITRISLPIEVHVADTLDNRDRAFSEHSTAFPDDVERERARAIAVEHGERLEPKHPLGYDDAEALVCFEVRCPNNTLPILWKDAPGWDALFPRL